MSFSPNKQVHAPHHAHHTLFPFFSQKCAQKRRNAPGERANSGRAERGRKGRNLRREGTHQPTRGWPTEEDALRLSQAHQEGQALPPSTQANQATGKHSNWRRGERGGVACFVIQATAGMLELLAEVLPCGFSPGARTRLGVDGFGPWCSSFSSMFFASHSIQPSYISSFALLVLISHHTSLA